MRVIWKYELLSGSIEVPVGNRFLDCQFQGNKIMAWFLVDPNETVIERIVYRILGTGIEFDGYIGEHWATLQDGELVWHIFRA